jgi:hypothetical protein
MKPIATLLVLGVVISACGGGGTAPSRAGSSSAIEGTWHGTITFTKPAPMTVQTTCTFTLLAEPGGRGFEARATWMGITTRAMTATVIGSQFSTNGTYPSGQGCDGVVGGLGTADPRLIDASFGGSSSCDSVFEGHMSLTR